jgi:hypothetical protein
LNANEASTIATLIPKQEILIKRPDFSKRVRLRVDPQSYWLYTNDPKDNQRRRDAFAQFGYEAGLERLTEPTIHRRM